MNRSPLTAHQGREGMTEVYFAIEETAEGFRWQLLTAEGGVVALSAECYPTLEKCHESIELVRRSRNAGIHDPEDG